MLRRLVISGGGTGGHIFPAIAIADAVKKINGDVEVLFVGAEGKMEMEKVPKAGYKIIGLPISGLKRSLSFDNVKLPFKLAKSLWKAGGLLKEFDPQVVVGVGGYASGPLLWQATRKGIPALIQEQNSYPGLTNKWLAERVQKICVAYEGMDAFFPAEKILNAGNPVRQELREGMADKNAALKYFGLDQNKKTLLVFGGSLGARTLNEAVLKGADQLASGSDIQLIWQTGKGQYDKYKALFRENWSNIRIMPFIDKMDLAYAVSDLVVCRAGALTLAELAVLAKPAVLVPSPNVTADHQKHNAMAFVKKDAAVMVEDDLAATKLIPTVIELMGDETRLRQLSENIQAEAKPDAALDIAAEVLKLATKGSGK